MKEQAGYLRKIGNLVARMSKAIVSGIPREKAVLKPRNYTIQHNEKPYAKPGSEKYYHRPTGKPVVEKQTLLKEKKKAKLGH